MRNPFEEHDEVLELLARVWYPTTVGMPPLGLPQYSPMFRDAKASSGNVHDDASEADERILRLRARAIGYCWEALPTWQLRVAVETRAANHAGAAVWRNARLTPEELAELWQEGRAMLLEAFIAKGLMEQREAA